MLAYHLFRCWASEYVALPELDANGSRVALQRLVIENEGWQRDHEIAEPTEPSFESPGPGGKQ